MKISFACEKCATVLEADAQVTGQGITCPRCGTSLKVPTVRPGPGVTIGGFRIKKLIARGGMGEVYLAEQLSLGRDVALKILPPHFKSDPETVQRFLAEVRTAAKLQHPNLVTVYEAGQDTGVYFLAMAYIDGQTLDQLLEQKGHLPEAQAMEIAHELAGALLSAWQSHKLIHCDVKPGNIMVDRNGKPHLMDMGLSKLLTESTTTAKAGEAFGTPNYVSPEQSLNEPNLDFRSDMFSLGMTLYHMLTGRLPFDAPTPSETLHKLDTETLPDPRSIVQGISPGCVVLLERLLGRKPSVRYPDWEKFLKECNRVRKGGKPAQAALGHGESVLGRSTGPSTSVLPLKRGPQPAAQPKPVSRRRLLVEMAGLVMIVGLIGTGLYMYRGKLKELFAKPEAPPPPVVTAVETNVAPSTTVIPEMPPPPVMSEREMELQKQFLAAQRFEKENANASIGARMKLYREIQRSGAGTVWADKAVIEIERLEATRDAALQEARKRLRTEVDGLVAKGKLEEAIARLRKPDSSFYGSLKEERMAQADKLQAQLDRQRNLTEKIKPFLAGVADELLRSDFVALSKRLTAAKADAVLMESAECKAVREMAVKVAAMPEAMVESLKHDIGKTVTLRTLKGEEKGEIVAVSGDTIQLKKPVVIDGQATGFVEVKYRITDLTLEEWLRRLSDDSIEQQLMRGLLTHQSKAVDKAREMFQQTGHPLGLLLAGSLDEVLAAAAQREKRLVETAARTAYNALLQLAGIKLENQKDATLPAAIRRTKMSSDVRAKLQTAVPMYWAQHGKTDWAKSHAEVVNALTDVGSKAEKVIRVDEDALDKALDKLKADNPDGAFNCLAMLEQNGVVLNLRGCQGLRNLSALARLPLKQLNLAGCVRVADISPLASMPLENVNLDDTLVEDLSPLRGAPLKEISLNRCKNIRSLNPLKECPLESLSVSGCPDDLDLAPILKLPGIRIQK